MSVKRYRTWWHRLLRLQSPSGLSAQWGRNPPRSETPVTTTASLIPDPGPDYVVYAIPGQVGALAFKRPLDDGTWMLLLTAGFRRVTEFAP